MTHMVFLLGPSKPRFMALLIFSALAIVIGSTWALLEGSLFVLLALVVLRRPGSRIECFIDPPDPM